ncbi:MAG: tetratricopeptide repeat protein [Patescibacteria group bacterium]|nr:tetratricopeptide repeat protein [Patescibacteria group bacterium]
MEISKETKIFLGIAKISIYFLIFLLPLFFLPWTSNVLEFNKQALLFILVFISLICWLASALIANRLEINSSFLNLPVIILLFISGFSVVLSLFRYGSFWGWPLPVAPSFLSLLCFVVLYFIITNLFKKEEIPFLFLALFLSGFLAAVFFLCQLFGKFIFPFDFSRNTSFNTIGTVNSLAIYFSLLLILVLPLFFFVKRFFKIILGIFGFTFLLCLFLINFKTAWLIFLTGSAVLFALGAVSFKKARHSGFITLLMGLLIIALIFVFLRFSIPGVPAFPLEISPSQRASFEILKSLPVKFLILGSGPGTFFYEWSKYKPLDINQTFFWGVRFSQPASEIFDRVITTGILGLLAFFFLAVVCLKKVFTFVLARLETKNPQEILNRFLAWGVFAGFIGLVFAFFLHPANLSLLFLFWLLVSFTTLLEEEKRQTVNLQTSPLKALGVSFFSILILILGIGLAILYGQKYVGEVRYFQGLRAWQRKEVDVSTSYLLRAVGLNSKMDLYWRDLSQISLFKLNELLARTDLSQEEMTTQAQVLIADAVNSAKQATEVDSNNVANWNIRGFVYRNMIGILGGAEDWALFSYERAKELEPTSPYIFTEIGRVHLLKSDLLDQQEMQKERAESLRQAQENFEKAIELKSDYAPAHFLTAMIYVREGKIKEAIDKLEATKEVASFDTGLAFQLGLIYYNNEQFNKAKEEFERAVLLDSNYSNARYFLGLIYDREGKKKEAISQFEKIEELNPDNEEVKKILANLRAGKPALEGVLPGEPPIEEKPAEQLEK